MSDKGGDEAPGPCVPSAPGDRGTHTLITDEDIPDTRGARDDKEVEAGQATRVLKTRRGSDR